MSLGHGARVDRTGLILQLDAANPKSHSGSNTQWVDLTRTNSSATLAQGFSKLSRSLQFDGVSQYASLPQNFWNHDAGNAYTISVWFKTSDTGPLFVQQDSDSVVLTVQSVPVLSITAQGYLRFEPFWTGSSTNATLSTVQVNDDEWHNAVAVYSDGIAALYVDGELNSNITGIAPVSYNEDYYYALSGGSVAGVAQYINAEISNFQFYSRALSRTTVRENFEAFRGRYGSELTTVVVQNQIDAATSVTNSRSPLPSASSDDATVDVVLDGGTA